jgi:hypothetical protein
LAGKAFVFNAASPAKPVPSVGAFRAAGRTRLEPWSSYAEPWPARQIALFFAACVAGSNI